MMGSAAAQQTLKKVDEAFKSFFGLLKVEGTKQSNICTDSTFSINEEDWTNV